MTKGNGTETLTDRWLTALKNHPLIATLLLFAAIVTGLASFTEAVDKLWGRFLGEEPGELTRSEEDLLLERAIIGTWRPQSAAPTPSGFTIKELHFTLLSPDIINWGGSYSYQGQDFPIMVSGTWHIRDNTLHYRVNSSNVPLVMKEGYASVTKIISIDVDEMIHQDPEKAKPSIALRIK